MIKKTLTKTLYYTIGASALLGWNTAFAHDSDDHKAAASNEAIQVDLGKVSEAFGNFIGRTLNNPAIGIKFDIESVITGIRNGAAGKPSPMSEKEYEEAIGILQEQGVKHLSEENLKKATEYLSTNAKAEGVKEIEPGKLQYKIIQEGTGPVVSEHASPLILYTGKFIDGTVFGSSDDTGPIRISLDRTIPGFSKGLIGMHQGEKRRLFIHPDLAYGTKGDLAPNALLIFDVEVVSANDEKKDNKKIDVDVDDEYEDDTAEKQSSK